MRTIAWGLFATLSMMGCSKQAAGDAAATSSATPAAPASRDDACSLLSLADIRRLLPDAARSERNDNLADQGIHACSWYGKGKAPVLDVSVWQVSGEDDTPMENASTLSMGIADPTRPGTQSAVRLEQVAGVGEDAVAIVEKTDDARGILTTAALLTFRQNGRIATVSSSTLAAGDRARALHDLTVLGKAIAARL